MSIIIFQQVICSSQRQIISYQDTRLRSTIFFNFFKKKNRGHFTDHDRGSFTILDVLCNSKFLIQNL